MTTQDPSARIAIIKWILQSFIGWALYGVILFLAVGRIDWVWGWAFMIILFLALASHVVVLVPLNPDLLVERSRGMDVEGTKAWDKWIVKFSAGIFPIVGWIIAGLHERFGWPGAMSLNWHIAGVVMSCAGWFMFMWAMASNAFFAESVRIQEERGHKTVTTGPYRFVRHPGYVGAIGYIISTPFVLGSTWALIPAVLAVVGYIVRTALEDRTLRDELEGYEAYTQQTRFRLFPGIW